MSKSFRIAVTSDPFIPVPPANYGGIERIIHFLVEGLNARGHEVALVAHPDSAVSSKLIPYAIRQEGISAHISNVTNINKLKAFKPDIIHSFSRLAYLLPFMLSNVPKLMSYQREPTISQIRKAIKFSRKGTLSFSGCSDYISSKIKPYASTYTVYNGIDLNIYNFKSYVPEDAALVFLGRVEPVKGPHIAVRAALATNKPLIIAGNIPKEYESFFKSEIEPHLNEKIRYVGPVNDSQKNELLGKALAFLMPIEWEEPFGIVMAEALACGTPVIGYGRGAVPEIVTHGINGYIAQGFDELCDFINSAAKLDRISARRSAETRFSSDVIVDEYIKVYRSLIKT